MKKNLNILIADNHSIVVTDLKDQLNGWGYDVFTSNGNNSITNHWIKKNNLDAIIIDDDFPKMEAGINTAFKISQRLHIGVILLCAWMSEEIEKMSSGLDSFYCLSKPFTNEELQKCLDLILKKQNN